MREIRYTNQFKRDFKRESKGRHSHNLDLMIRNIVDDLIRDINLPDKYLDHAMIGNWSDHRNCLIKPDLILIYRRVGETEIHLIRLGSHSELSI